MIDGFGGYRLGLRGDDSHEQLIREIHAVCWYLKRMGGTVILIEAGGEVTGELRIETGGLHVGEWLSGYRGILTGIPERTSEER